jgi:hypothetical protein
MTIKRFVSAIVLGAVLFGAIAAPAIAAPGEPGVPAGEGECAQSLHDLGLLSSEGTVGDAISDGFYGNEPNTVDYNSDPNAGPSEVEPGDNAGGVDSSQSPGPKVMLPNGEVVAGSSYGDYRKLGSCALLELILSGD